MNVLSRFDDNIIPDDSRSFCSCRREAQLHFVLRHPNIVDLLGYSEKSPVCMVMERMEESLYDCIHRPIQLDLSTKMGLLTGITTVRWTAALS